VTATLALWRARCYVGNANSALSDIARPARAEGSVSDSCLDPGPAFRDRRRSLRGIGRTDALTESELNALSGGPFQTIVDEIQALVPARARPIVKLTDHFAALPTPASLSYDEVILFVGDGAAR
jgi:hypothetical protein